MEKGGMERQNSEMFIPGSYADKLCVSSTLLNRLITCAVYIVSLDGLRNKQTKQKSTDEKITLQDLFSLKGRRQLYHLEDFSDLKSKNLVSEHI